MKCTVAVICFGYFGACVSTRGTFSNKTTIALVQRWLITYTSETGGVDPGGIPRDQFEEPAESSQLKSDLQLPDQIFLHLKKKYHVSVTTEPGLADGQIRLHAVKFINGGVRSLDVALFDRGGQLLGHTRVSNRGRQNVFNYDDDFAEYAAEAIAELLGSK